MPEKPKVDELLRSYLSDEQLRTYERHSFFYVRAKNGEIFALTDGWCVWQLGTDHTPSRIYHIAPVVDGEYIFGTGSLVAQMLLLETDPTYLLDEACHYGTTGWAEKLPALFAATEYKAFVSAHRPRKPEPEPTKPPRTITTRARLDALLHR